MSYNGLKQMVRLKGWWRLQRIIAGNWVIRLNVFLINKHITCYTIFLSPPEFLNGMFRENSLQVPSKCTKDSKDKKCVLEAMLSTYFPLTCTTIVFVKNWTNVDFSHNNWNMVYVQQSPRYKWNDKASPY